MMKNNRLSILKRIAILIIVVTLVTICNDVTASETSSRASDYINSYNSYVYNAAFGKIRVYFDVTGVHYMDDIGALNIKVYESTDGENWYWVETYSHDSTSQMLGQDEVYHSGYIEYGGTIGRYYKAYVCIWAGKDGGGDTRYMWTNVKKATLLAG